MAKILHSQVWYYELAPSTLLEADFERLILQHSADIFPDYYTVPFSVIVQSDYGSARADLALIHTSYRHWWVVEVEMGRHPFGSHVYPQVQRLATAAYGVNLAGEIARCDNRLDPQSLSEMLRGAQPRVLVIVDSPKPEWSLYLSPYHALVTVFQVFRSDDNRHLFRLNGDSPHTAHESVTTCRSDATIPNFVVVDSPATLPGTPNDSLAIRFAGRRTSWSRLSSADTVWLVPEGSNPLKAGVTYAIVRLDNGELEFQPRRSPGGRANGY